MEPFRALIAGGGVAAIEGLLRLRRLAPDIDVTLLAPNEEFGFRALSVKEPFAMGKARRYPLEDIAASANAKWLRDGLSWIDTEARAVHTTAGETLPFDALLVAVGGEMVPAFTHARTYRDAEADDIFGGVVQDIEGGYCKSVAFLAPDGPAWPLPLYELALMTAKRAEGMGASVELCVVTPEPAPLASFGGAAGEAVVELLDQAGVTVYASAQAQVPAARHLLVQPHGVELTPDSMIAMPRVRGRAIRGLPGGAQGFIPIDDHCAVPGTGGHVYAAGDATAFPVKHGGLGAQQADTAAAAIARSSGADVEAAPYRPVLRGMLLTGGKPLFLSARVVGGRGFESEVSTEPLWEPVEKVSAEELTAYLRAQN